MKRILLGLVAAAMTCATAHAVINKTYIASCNDGQNLQLNISEQGAGLLYAKTSKGILQIAASRLSVLTDTYVCATPLGSSATDPNAMNLCITLSKAAGGLTPSAIIVARKFQGGGIQEQGVVCKANVKTSI
jgi:hypothetical protein